MLPGTRAGSPRRSSGGTSTGRLGRTSIAGSVSKTLVPALRLGWLVVPPGLLDAVIIPFDSLFGQVKQDARSIRPLTSAAQGSFVRWLRDRLKVRVVTLPIRRREVGEAGAVTVDRRLMDRPERVDERRPGTRLRSAARRQQDEQRNHRREREKRFRLVAHLPQQLVARPPWSLERQHGKLRVERAGTAAALLTAALLVPAHLRAVDAKAIDRAGAPTPCSGRG